MKEVYKRKKYIIQFRHTYPTYWRWNTQEHGYHILKKNSISAFLTSSIIGLTPFYFKFFPVIEFPYLAISWCLVIGFSIWLWAYSIINESEKHHTIVVRKGLLLGFVLFLISEIMFFFSIFWAFFYLSIEPSVSIGNQWPPLGTFIWNIHSLPTLNTLILLLSGLTLTYSHQSLILGHRKLVLFSLILTVLLGIEFSICQFFEYYSIQLQVNDSVFSSIFFLATGFHGLHVIVGSLLLIIQIIEFINLRVLIDQHVGFEAAIWYWHFVDVVWLFLFIFIYYWGII